MNQHPKGFSLIELIIVVAIVGILASVVIPSYNNQVMKSRRTDATIALSELAHAMERYHTTQGSYSGAQTSDASPAPTGTVYSATSPEGFYDLSVTVPNDNNQRYTVTAAPDANESMAGDTTCGTYSLDYRQVKCVTVSGTAYCSDGNAAAREKVRQCW